MATNRVFKDGEFLGIDADNLTGPNDPIESGDPVLFGVVPGVALTAPDADDIVSVQFGGVYEFPVVGADGAGNAAIAIADPLYHDSGVINADETNGTLFGYALAAVASGATTTIRVKLARV